VVEAILLNIAVKSFHARQPERALLILRNERGKGKSTEQGNRIKGQKGKKERVKGKGKGEIG